MNDFEKLKHDLQQTLVKDTVRKEVIYCLDNYLEPWTCPNCYTTTKIPFNHKDPQHCIKCNTNDMLSYSYLQAQRQDIQIKILLSCVNYYLSQKNKSFATKTITRLTKVDADLVRNNKPSWWEKVKFLTHSLFKN